mmetsp:Transcript_62283/g.91303  ORF Transcript_62283/g.91303 Transcript_62283/m.91303 type:complete len:204 (-) Transcript_62283:2100-2711(-)
MLSLTKRVTAAFWAGVTRQQTTALHRIAAFKKSILHSSAMAARRQGPSITKANPPGLSCRVLASNSTILLRTRSLMSASRNRDSITASSDAMTEAASPRTCPHFLSTNSQMAAMDSIFLPTAASFTTASNSRDCAAVKSASRRSSAAVALLCHPAGGSNISSEAMRNRGSISVDKRAVAYPILMAVSNLSPVKTQILIMAFAS